MAALQYYMGQKTTAPPYLMDYILLHHVFPGIAPDALDRMDKERVEAHLLIWEQQQLAAATKAGAFADKKKIKGRGNK